MSYKSDFLAIRSRKQPVLYPPSSSSQRASSSSRTSWHRRICSSSSLPTYTSRSSQDDFDHLDPLDETALGSDLDQRTASSATLLSPCLSPSLSTSPSSTDEDSLSSNLGSRQSRFLYPLYEPGQMTAQHIQKLRSRTASVIMSIPATSEDVDEDEDEPHRAASAAPATPVSKLRRIPGVRDLRSAFHDSGRGPAHSVPTPSFSSFELSKASYEIGFLVTPAPRLSQSHLSPRSSLRTLVDMGNAPPTSGDLKTLCESTLSSTSIASRFSTKVQSPFPRSLSSKYTFLPTDISRPDFPKKYPVHSSPTPQPYHHVSLHQDTRLSRSPGGSVWSCAKISQSETKRAARRGHTPRRVFSNPIAGLPP